MDILACVQSTRRRRRRGDSMLIAACDTSNSYRPTAPPSTMRAAPPTHTAPPTLPPGFAARLPRTAPPCFLTRLASGPPCLRRLRLTPCDSRLTDPDRASPRAHTLFASSLRANRSFAPLASFIALPRAGSGGGQVDKCAPVRRLEAAHACFRRGGVNAADAACKQFRFKISHPCAQCVDQLVQLGIVGRRGRWRRRRRRWRQRRRRGQ
jgi:hypothetical protein